MLSADYQNEEISSFLRPKWGMKKSVTGDSMTLIRHCCWFPASKRGNSWNTRRVNFCVPLLTKCNGYQELKPPIGFEHLNDGWQFFSRKFQASKAEILGDMSGESLGRHLFGNPTRYQALQASASGRRHEWYRAGPALCSENSAQRRQRRRCWRRMEGSRPRPSRTIRRSSLWLGAAVDLGEGWCVWCAIASTPLSFDVWFCDTTGCFLWFVDAQYMSRPWKLYRLYMMHGQKKVMIWGSDLIPTPGHPGHPGRLQDGSIDGKQPSELRSYKLLLGFESLWFFSMVDHCGPLWTWQSGGAGTLGAEAMDQGHLMAPTPQPIICALASLICWSTRQHWCKLLESDLNTTVSYRFDPFWYFPICWFYMVGLIPELYCDVTVQIDF